ncbi:MAG: hypothetical protein IJ578_00635 [Bacteroidales bacterium]|nr:hypothetical protein [Bacteroidales bacterium]
MKLRILAAMAAAVLLQVAAPGGLFAQTPTETKLYNKTMKKPSVKAYDKFLKKFPDAFYSQEILRLRDTELFAKVNKEDAQAVKDFAQAHPDSPISDEIAAVILSHNTSPLSREEAKKVAADYADAVGWRKDNVDHVMAIGLKEGTISLQSLSLQGAPDAEPIPVQIHTLSDLTPSRLEGGLETVTIGNKNYLHFSYLNEGESSEKEWVDALYDADSQVLYNVMFYGKELATKAGPVIEGQCLEELSGGLMTPQMAWLLGKVKENPSLKQISRADLLTDESIAWWLDKNPSAQTSARTVRFGALDPESSIVEMYKKSRKENGTNFNAALFDLRGYTMICAYSKSTKDYILVWCEPVCKNRNRDQLLNTIYFENGNTLDLFYYKGRTTFKVRINLANKNLRRS